MWAVLILYAGRNALFQNVTTQRDNGQNTQKYKERHDSGDAQDLGNSRDAYIVNNDAYEPANYRSEATAETEEH
jgi:hypothetical protein